MEEGGSDFLTGGLGNDELHGGENGDRIGGNEGNDLIFGEAGDDTLVGGPGNDTLEGGEGNDGIIGGAGDDVLTGDAGSDQFRYDLPPVGGGQDIITDFITGVDDLFLGGITAAQLDTDGNASLDDGDGRVSVVNSNLVIDIWDNNTLTLGVVVRIFVNRHRRILHLTQDPACRSTNPTGTRSSLGHGFEDRRFRTLRLSLIDMDHMAVSSSGCCCRPVASA